MQRVLERKTSSVPMIIPRRWRLLFLACLIAGMIFRVVNLDGKVYWNDETYTSLRVSGYEEVEAIQQLSQAGLVSAKDFQRYQYPISDAKSTLNLLKGLAAEEPQLTPLYFVAARVWEQWFGHSVAVIRSLSVIAGLLAFPCMGWLCWELFETPLAAWVGAAMIAVSPFHVLYAQEARPIAWWATTILFSSAALLRAMRLQTRASWVLYTIASAVSFYTYLFSGLVAIAHLIYLFAVERFKVTKRVIAGVASLCLSAILFLPWFLVVLLNASQANTATAWARAGRASLSDLYSVWAHHLLLAFLDPYVAEAWSTFIPRSLHRLFPTLLFWAVRLVILYAFYVLWRRAPLRVSLFITALTVVPALALVLPDIILGGSLSRLPRYMVPVYLGFELVVTYLLSKELLGLVDTSKQRIWWRGVTITTLAIGFVFCAYTTQAKASWNKIINTNNVAVAQIINQSHHPLVLSDADLGDLLSLSYFLDPNVRLLVRPQPILSNINRQFAEIPYLPEIPPGFSDIFLFKPRPLDAWLNHLKQQKTYQVRTISEGFDNWLWQLKHKP